MRFKNRYFLLELLSKVPLDCALEDQAEFVTALRTEALDAVGLVGASQLFSAFKVIHYDMKANFVVLRVSRAYARVCRKVLFFVRTLKGTDVKVRVVATCGTIRSAERRLIMHLKTEEHKGVKSLFSAKDVCFE